jgi:hypothetical protein
MGLVLRTSLHLTSLQMHATIVSGAELSDSHMHLGTQLFPHFVNIGGRGRY